MRPVARYTFILLPLLTLSLLSAKSVKNSFGNGCLGFRGAILPFTT